MFTAEQCRAKGACEKRCKAREEQFPNGFTLLDIANSGDGYAILDSEWLIENLYPAVAWAEYEKADDAAYAEYAKIRDAAWLEHEKDIALAKYNEIRDAAWAEYNKTCLNAILKIAENFEPNA